MTDTLILENSLNTIRNTDIYLIDLILKRHFKPSMKIMDAGCGMGRNVEYFLQSGNEVFGADISAEDVNYLRKHAMEINLKIKENNFRVEPLEAMTFEPESMDVVICSAVLHFAKNEDHFNNMVHGAWKLLKPGGIFFCRLSSTIGIENEIMHVEGRRYLLPDGTNWFLADEAMLLELTLKMNAQFLEPFKTVNVHHKRCMTNWILKK